MPAPISSNPLAYVRPDGLTHPAVDLGAFESACRMSGPGLVKFVRKCVPNDHKYGFNRILETDFLSLFIGAPVIADGRLINLTDMGNVLQGISARHCLKSIPSQ